MGTLLTTTLAERDQAIQQLEAAFGQPNGSMVFTFNGAVYQSEGVNSDGTLRVRNVTTGEVTYALDPVEIYAAARAASGDPMPAPPTPASNPQQQSSFSLLSLMFSVGSMFTLFGKAGVAAISHFMQAGINSAAHTLNTLDPTATYVPSKAGLAIEDQISPAAKLANVLGKALAIAGIALGSLSIYQSILGSFTSGKVTKGQLFNLGMSSLGVAMGVNAFLGGGFMAMLTNPAGWYAAAAVISMSVESGAIQNMVLNGPSAGMAALAAGGFMGTAILTNFTLEYFFEGMSMFGPIGFMVAGAVALFSFLWALFHQPPPEQIAAMNLTKAINPVIWTPGPMALVGIGTVAALMGWLKTQTPPAMASLTVPTYYVNQKLAQTFNNVRVGNNLKSPGIFVQPDSGEVVIVSPAGVDSRGIPLLSLQSFELGKNLQFVSSPDAPPDGAYIPFFNYVNGKLDTHPSADVLKALTTQDKMLQAALSGALSTLEAMNAVNVAASANKYGVNPAY